MIFKTIPLREDAPDVVLDAYIADPYRKKRKALLILPGGAYRFVCGEREGEPVALAFMPHGFNAFVLHYSVNRKRVFPAPLVEAAMAIKHIKDNAEEYGIDPEELFVVGFSAGGHLAACCGVLWKHPAIYEALDMPYGYNKPKGIMPIYPVIHGHAASFKNMWCTDTPSQEQKEQVLGILSCEGSGLFMDYFKERLEALFALYLAEFSQAVPRDFLLNHLVGSFAEAVRWWAGRTMADTPETVAEAYMAMLP